MVCKFHLLRLIRQMVNEALMKMNALCAEMYDSDVKGVRPSIAPEKLLRAMLLQVFYNITRSLSCSTTCSKWPTNKTGCRASISSVDGTLFQAWAGHKSFVRKDGSDEPGGRGSFKAQTRCNETHESTTDADARLYRKGKTGSELRFMGHTLTDNRHELIANAVVTTADGHAEREAAKAMVHDANKQQAMRTP